MNGSGSRESELFLFRCCGFRWHYSIHSIHSIKPLPHSSVLFEKQKPMLYTFTDQMQRSTMLEHPPKRIVSLVPSQTELLHYLGLEDEVVGITKFCVHPEAWFRNKTRVGGTKMVKSDVIASLEPDLIIGNKEENERSQIEELEQDYPVWMSDIQTLADALHMIRAVGELVGKKERARELAQQIETDFEQLQAALPASRLRAAYFIWRQPYMVVAGDTFIDEMLRIAGFANVFASQSRYPEIQLGQLAELQPDVILLSSEPFPFKEKHFAEFKQICPKAVIKIVDGELFSWYGSRLLQSAAYFRKLQSELSVASRD